MKEIKRIPDYQRNITGRTRRILPFTHKVMLWFLNIFNLLGLLFFIIGGIFVIIFFPWEIILNESVSVKDLMAEGKITAVTYANAEVNEKDVMRYDYTYTTPDGEYTGYGFATGEIFDVGDDVIVYYKSRNPSVSMVPEFRKNLFPLWVGTLVLIFPLIGLAALFFGTKKVINNIRILQVGELAKGKLIEKKATNASVDEQPVYALTFEFVAKDGNTYRASTKTHKPYLLEDNTEEQLFYDPENPGKAVLLDTLPPVVKKIVLKQSS